MLDFLKKSKSAIEALDGDTQNLLLKALTLVMYADGIIKDSENEVLERAVGEVNWTNQLNFGNLLTQTRDAMDDERMVDQIINDIRSLDAEKNQFIIDECLKLADVDNNPSYIETSIIRRMRK